MAYIGELALQKNDPLLEGVLGAANTYAKYQENQQNIELEKQKRKEALDWEKQKIADAKAREDAKIAQDQINREADRALKREEYIATNTGELTGSLAAPGQYNVPEFSNQLRMPGDTTPVELPVTGLERLTKIPQYNQKFLNKQEEEKLSLNKKQYDAKQLSLPLEQRDEYKLAVARASAVEGAKKGLEKQETLTEASTIEGLTPIKKSYTPDDVKVAKDAIANANELRKTAQNLKDTLKVTGTTFTKQATLPARELSAAIARVQLPLKEFEKLGVLAGPDMGILEAEIGNLQGAIAGSMISKEEAVKRVDGLVKYVEDRASERLKSRGFEPKFNENKKSLSREEKIRLLKGQ